ncbi:MAG: hypothetical protein LBO21_08650 [Synergistaceae bacterium]|jgi:hypothetical protein|nr:hypothetical protein [Synergistaceae bacterium]
MRYIRNISDQEWNKIKKAESEQYVLDAIGVSHMIAHIMLDLQVGGKDKDSEQDNNFFQDLDTLIQTTINVFRHGERDEVSDLYDCADRLAALGEKLEKLGGRIRENIDRINRVRPESFAKGWYFDEEDWYVLSCDEEEDEDPDTDEE